MWISKKKKKRKSLQVWFTLWHWGGFGSPICTMQKCKDESLWMEESSKICDLWRGKLLTKVRVGTWTEARKPLTCLKIKAYVCFCMKFQVRSTHFQLKARDWHSLERNHLPVVSWWFRSEGGLLICDGKNRIPCCFLCSVIEDEGKVNHVLEWRKSCMFLSSFGSHWVFFF